jgi:hypothetical protein
MGDDGQKNSVLFQSVWPAAGRPGVSLCEMGEEKWYIKNGGKKVTGLFYHQSTSTIDIVARRRPLFYYDDD